MILGSAGLASWLIGGNKMDLPIASSDQLQCLGPQRGRLRAVFLVRIVSPQSNTPRDSNLGRYL
jgi:hypothetical protein